MVRWMFFICILSVGFVMNFTQWVPGYGLAFQSTVADDDGGSDDGGSDDGGSDDGGSDDGGSDDGGSDDSSSDDSSSDDGVDHASDDHQGRGGRASEHGSRSGDDDSGNRADGTYVSRVAAHREEFDEAHLDQMTKLRASAGENLGHLEGRHEYAVTEENREVVETSIQSSLESRGFKVVSGSQALSVIREVLSNE